MPRLYPRDHHFRTTVWGDREPENICFVWRHKGGATGIIGGGDLS